MNKRNVIKQKIQSFSLHFEKFIPEKVNKFSSSILSKKEWKNIIYLCV